MKTEEKADKKKIQLKTALIELVDVETNKIDVGEFCKNEVQEAEKTSNSDDSSQEQPKYSDDDIPRQAQTKRRNYDELMKVVEEFFEREKLIDIFLKLRAYIKKHFND